MNYRFSDPVAGLKPSAIREILKNSGDTIPLSAGNPAPDAFPVSDVKEITAKILEEEPILALQYGVTEGYDPLIAELTKLAHEHYGVGTDNDSIIVVSGATQIMSLVSQVFLNPGDTVICEEPSFIGSLNCFRAHGARLVGVPVESDGIDVDALEETLKKESGAKFIYTIPNFQNPSGATMSFEKRKRMYALARQYGVLILEDNPYGDLRVAGDDVPAIKSLDTDGLVIYAGSFSKIIAPGIRVGFVVSPSEISAKLTVAKQTQDVHTTMLSQLLVYKWLKAGKIEDHIKKIKDIYRRKLNLMCDSMDAQLSDYLTYHRPEGGLFVWAKLNQGINMIDYVKTASKNGVSVVPGNAFLIDSSAPCDYIRLNFSTPSDEGIVEGIKLLKETAEKMR
ncbi:MAG: PLP-dependent aminotransferase family protein [Clostridia bacterium]|nr:PLP-dependent aminotransferase family protein [Clostridia bacterium]